MRRLGLAVFAVWVLGSRAVRADSSCPLPPNLWEAYFAARREDHGVRAAVALSRISRRLLVDPAVASSTPPLSSAEYLACLHDIEARAVTEPAAALDLARALQLRWEVLYWTPTARAAQLRAEERCRKGGLSVGALAWGIALWRRPQDVPKYFRYVRHFLPLAGWSAGHAVAAGAPSSRPEAPARVWRLPQVPNADEVEARQDTEELLAMASGVTAGALSYDVLAAIPAVRAANLACTPLKIHPGVLLGSLVLGFVAEEGLKAAAASYEDWESQRVLDDGRRALAVALRRGDDFAAFRAAESVVEGTLRLVYGELRKARPDASARVQKLLASSTAILLAAHREYLDPSTDYLRAFSVRWEAL